LTAWVELPSGDRSWGTRRQVTVTLEKLGYHVELYGFGEDWQLLLS